MLDGLVDAGGPRPRRRPRRPERGQYQFIQGVLREVAYGRLSRRERLARHLAAAAYFEAAAGDELRRRRREPLPQALRSAPDDADRARSGRAGQAGARGGGRPRSTAIGAHASAAGYLADAVDARRRRDRALRLLEARADAL